MQSTSYLIVVTALLFQLSIAAAQTVDIVQTALNDGRFKTLAAAVTAADLVEALQGPGPFTVFAPTDAAFAKLPPDTVSNLLKSENKGQLVDLLQYHVVAGQCLTAAQILAMPQPIRLQMLNGRSVAVTTSGGQVKFNNANLVATNVQATNGIIHIIDAVL